jgi:hypothetical protein
MPRSAYDAMVNDYKVSFPEENPMDIIRKIIPSVNQGFEATYQFKGGEIETSFDSPDIQDSGTNSLITSSLWGVSEKRNGKEVYHEDGSIDCLFEPYQAQTLLPKYYIVRVEYEILPHTNTEIVNWYQNDTTLQLDNNRKNDPEYVRMQVNGIIKQIFSDFQRELEYRLRNNEDLRPPVALVG